MNFPKINQKMLVNGIIAYLVVSLVPALLKKYVWNPGSALMEKITGAVAAYLVGMLLKKPDISMIGLAIAAADFVQDELAKIIGLEPSLVLDTSQNLEIAQTATDNQTQMSGYFRLNGYGGTELLNPASSHIYEKFYQNN